MLAILLAEVLSFFSKAFKADVAAEMLLIIAILLSLQIAVSASFVIPGEVLGM
jgi:hypothetical protein